MKKRLVNYFFRGLLLVSPLSAQALDQWATKMIGFSSQFSTTNWSAAQVLKAANTNAYGDYWTAWAPATSDFGQEFLTVEFATPVHADGVTVRETDGYGFVTGIDVTDINGVSHNVWTGVDTSVSGQINDFKITWPRTTYWVKGVTVHMNTALHSGWEEVDAIQLHGLDTLNGTISPHLSHTATLVCTNVTTAQTITTTIKGTGTTDPVTHWDCEKSGLKFKVGDTVSISVTGKISQ